mgnify:CR=1 FL=1
MNWIPLFPPFTFLSINHKNSVDDITKHFEPYSDFNFTSLFSWQGEGEAQVSQYNNNLIIKIPHYLTGEPVYSILGKDKVDDAINLLLTNFKALSLVPEITLKNMVQAEKYEIKEDSDNFDYLYSVNDLVSLTGTTYKKVRNKINSFTSDHAESAVATSSTRNISDEYVQTILSLNSKWVDESSNSKQEAYFESQAIKTLLENANALNIIVVEIMVDNEIKGFSINEILPNGYSICHFEKTLKSHHVNTGHYLVHEVAKLLKTNGIHTTNWEQDLGIEGLRRSKESYRPIKFLKKYKHTKQTNSET